MDDTSRRTPKGRRAYSSGGPTDIDAGFVPERVSIIIPSYNYAHFLPAALQSVLFQRGEDIEVIVVDDGSTDRTREILQGYGERIRRFHQANAGLSAARNTGVRAATGEYIAFLDADDLLGPRTVAAQTAFLRHRPDVAMAVCPSRLFHRIVDGRPRVDGAWPLLHDRLEIHLCFGNVAPIHSYMVRRRTLAETGFFDPRLGACEDWDYWLRAVAAGGRIGRNPRGTVYYRKHPASMSADLTKQRHADARIHRRIDGLMNRYPDFPLGHRLEGRMALACGAVLTAIRSPMLTPEIRGDMMRLAKEQLDRAIVKAETGSGRWNFPVRLFYWRCRTYLAHADLHRNRFSGSLRHRLERIRQALGGPEGASRDRIDGMLSAVAGIGPRAPERGELLRLAFRGPGRDTRSR